MKGGGISKDGHLLFCQMRVLNKGSSHEQITISEKKQKQIFQRKYGGKTKYQVLFLE